jgi:cell division protein FtsW (lipid II flippase)
MRIRFSDDEFTRGQTLKHTHEAWRRGLLGSVRRGHSRGLGFRPEPPTRPILAPAREELRLVGIALVAGLMTLLVWRGLTGARRARGRRPRCGAPDRRASRAICEVSTRVTH